MKLTRVWRPEWPCPIGSALGPLRHGGDLTMARDADGTWWRATRTPDGPGTLRVRPLVDEEIVASAWGPGAAWLLDSLPTLLGADDSLEGFDPGAGRLSELHRQRPHARIGRGQAVFESLVPAICEQKVTGLEASQGYRALVSRHGEPAPGPRPGLRLAPSPETVAMIPSWEWLAMGIDPARSRAIVTAAKLASSLERTLGVDHAEADRRLRSVPGIGLWTSAEVRVRAHGDPDAVSFGDYHVARDVGYALTGQITDDAGLEELLEPWRGHRARVVRLVVGARISAPRHGPRMAPRTHLPTSRSSAR
ncbi:MAG TPA: DNA-3-methyladenine glycosylase 2 family protein [Propionibacteriaceae bacterium]|nr:DNA-3-methyladenine glycosylase 2 family protein [Propionibacteriaceae bacterium]